MKVYTLSREQLVHRPLDETFAFFADPNNLEEITPSWLKFHVVSTPAELQAGSQIYYRLNWHGLPLSWTTEVQVWTPPFEFVDIQKSGPYALWRHTHRLSARRGATLVSDHVEYALPFGPIGNLAYALLVHRDVEKIFEYRTQRIAELLDGSTNCDTSPQLPQKRL